MKKEQALAARLHPRLRDWFLASFPGFTHAQLLCVPSVLHRESILLTSPTGSGKTLAGFLGVFDSLLRELESNGLKPGVRCIYISPLRALAYDIEKNLRGPIAGMGLENELRIHLRTGDTPASERAKFRSKPSHFLVTTPESLAILLAQQSYAQHLAHAEFVIVDELHSFAGNKRGADLRISLERLREVAACRTQKQSLPRRSFCDRCAARFAGPISCRRKSPCRIAEAAVEKEQIVEFFLRSGAILIHRPATPASPLRRTGELIRSRQSVIVFTNVRSAAEQIGLRLREQLPNWPTRSKFITLRSIAACASKWKTA